MAAKPTPGGSDGTYGTELNAFLDVSLASDGKIADGAVFSTSAAPSVDAGVANKLYVDNSGYNDRGDPASYDYVLADLTTDETWRDLDLGSIISDSLAKGVVLNVSITDDAASSRLFFRKKGNSNTFALAAIRTQVANIVLDADLVVSCDTSQVIQYWAANVTWTTINIIVKGWWT